MCQYQKKYLPYVARFLFWPAELEEIILKVRK